MSRERNERENGVFEVAGRERVCTLFLGSGLLKAAAMMVMPSVNFLMTQWTH